MNVKKRLVLISLFVIQQFFISFIINCGEDSAYDQTQTEEGSEANANETVCDCEGFLTEECVDECQDEANTDEDDANDNEEPASDDGESSGTDTGS